MRNENLRTMLYLTLLSVISFLLMYVLEIPLLPAAPFLKYDLSEVIAISTGFLFGPVAGSVVVLLKSILFFLSGKNQSGWVGLLASALAGLSLVWGTTLLYHFKKNNNTKVMGVFLGTLLLTVLMTGFNYFFLLGWYGIPTEQFAPYIFTAIVPFNMIKGMLSTVLSLLVFNLLKDRLNKFIHKD